MSSIAQVVSAINANKNQKGVIYAAGGGLSIFSMLGEHGGSSGTILSARIPYVQEDFIEVLGAKPDHFVDAVAARQLASAAFVHALRIRGSLDPANVFGVGSTSKLTTGATERVGRKHEIHAAIQTSETTICVSAEVDGGSDRAYEEHINALMILNLIASVKTGRDYENGHVDPPLQVELDGFACTDYKVVTPKTDRVSLGFVGDVLIGKKPYVSLGGIIPTEPVLYPGSWRPLHEGHVGVRRAAEKLLGKPVSYELSIINADKPPLDFITIQTCIEQFWGTIVNTSHLIITNAPTFIDKARLFPKATFVMGYDTVRRFLNPKYYGGSAQLDSMLFEAEMLGMRLLIFGRIDDSGIFKQIADDFLVNPRVRRFFESNVTLVPEEVFRRDISSTEIRRRPEATLYGS